MRPTVSWPSSHSRLEVGLVVDQIGVGALAVGDLDESIRIRARFRADDEHERRLLADALDRVLAVLGRVADVRRGRADEIGDALAESIDHVGGVVEGKSRLGQVGELLALLQLERLDVLGGLDEDDRVRGLPHRALDLDVAGVPDERDLVAAPGIATRLGVHLGDERAHGVDDLEPAFLALLVDLRRHSVSREDDERTLGHLVLRLDEDGSPLFEVAHDVHVVDDLVADVHRRAVALQQLLDDVDGAHDAGAEAARAGDEDALAHRAPSGGKRGGGAAEARERPPRGQGGAQGRARLRGEGLRDHAPVGGPVARRRVREPADGLLGRVGDGPDDAREAAGGCERGALGVDCGGARAARQLPPLDGVVHDPAGVAHDRREGAGDAQRLVLPEDGALGVDDAPCGQERARLEAGDERARQPEGDERP